MTLEIMKKMGIAVVWITGCYTLGSFVFGTTAGAIVGFVVGCATYPHVLDDDQEYY